MFTDNRSLATWIHDAWSGGHGRPFGLHPSVFDVRLTRGDRAVDERAWLIDASDVDLQIVWRRFGTPVVSDRGEDPSVYSTVLPVQCAAVRPRG